MRRVNSKSGMSLIEVMVALGIVSVVLMSLGGLMYEIAQASRKSALATYRAAASQYAAAWVSGLEWDSLDTAIGCSTHFSGILEYNRCVTITTVSSTRKTATVVIQPTGLLITRPDTQVIERTVNLKSSALVLR